MAAKKTKKSRSERNRALARKLSRGDRREVAFQAGGAFREPRQEEVTRALKNVAGKPGAFQSKPKGKIRVSKKNPSAKAAAKKAAARRASRKKR